MRTRQQRRGGSKKVVGIEFLNQKLTFYPACTSQKSDSAVGVTERGEAELCNPYQEQAELCNPYSRKNDSAEYVVGSASEDRTDVTPER